MSQSPTLNAARAEIPSLTVKELDADPHGVFRRYRPQTPFVAHEAGGYMILRAPDVEMLSRDSRAQATETEFPKLFGINDGALFEFFDEGMLMANDAVHRRRRSPFTRSFAAKLMSELRPRIRKIAEDLIDDWYAAGEADLVEQYAALIPARTICELLGLPQEDIPRFTALVYEVTRALSFSFQPEDIPGMQSAAAELRDYVEQLLHARRRMPSDDFLSAFVIESDQKGELSAIEGIIQIVSLIIGGTDTTRVAMVAQVFLLLEHREQWDAVCRDPALIPGAVIEAMRYEPSVASMARKMTEDVEVDGRILPAGQFVTLSTMSAMRDERIYDRPDVFDICRTDQVRLHPIFGGGPHRCIGEALARIELEEGLAALTTRLPQLRQLGDPPRFQGHAGIRRVDEMRVGWSI
ncbi:MAG TPA: cytochrome P450 [Aliidongia sp.]|nr:cytochrome P450 [Aliidongia sp.]